MTAVTKNISQNALSLCGHSELALFVTQFLKLAADETTTEELTKMSSISPNKQSNYFLMGTKI